MQGDIQQALEQLLAIEREAAAIVEQAKAEARRLRSEGAEAAEAAKLELLAQTRQMADKMIADARSNAEADRDRRLAQNTLELEEMDRLARLRKDVAVAFVVAQLKGEGDTSRQRVSRRAGA
ncbi:MAG: hypothetical protein ACOX87_01170 [Chloroflexota bacterium]|jgi:vacuolar-type H+-ATPase subunit H